MDEVSISGNDITDLSPLANVKTITVFLTIGYTPNLLSLDGLNGLTSVKRLTIADISNLESINGFPALISVEEFRIYNNPNLKNINGFPALNSVGILHISNPNLKNINGFSALTSIGGYLSFQHNANLESINGFSALTSVKTLYIQNNAVLTDISGLRHINPNSIGDLPHLSALRIFNNPQLAVCQLFSLCSYLKNPGPFPRVIHNNATSCESEQALITACESSLCNFVSGIDYTFNTQAEIDNFGLLYRHCTDITLGSVVIGYSLGTASSDITDLSPLANIKTITGGLTIRNNPNLLSLNGLTALTSIGELLNIQNNANLENINGFPALASIEESLNIQNNANLEEINGFPALTSIGTYLRFQNNSKLEEINGFPALTSIGTYLRIENNAVLTDISGLQHINLATITGQYGLEITNNPQLEVCNLSNICTYLSGTGVRTISGNKTTCLNEQAVITACNPCPTAILGDKTFNTQADINAFATEYGSCTDIILGNVVIGYLTESTLSDITDLSPLANVKTITGHLFIRNNPNLFSLDGLNGFPILTSVGTYLDIWNNANLENINGFPALTSTGKEVYIFNNDKLENINGFPALTSIGTFLYIGSNDKLENINGFPVLTSIGAYLSISYNSVLTDISGLQNIDPATITGTRGLEIINNPQLEVCHLSNICAYLSTSKPRTISGNKTTCLNEAAVVAACEAALPVTLVDFSATPDEQSVLLEWHTTSESNASHYEIQRSADGRLWQEIGAIAAAGESDAPLAYRHRDLRPLPGLSYYRLKMIDHTGGHGDAGFAYSEIRSVVRAERMDTALKLYPNPVTDRVYLETEGVITEVLLWDIAGRLVRKERYQEGIGISIDGLGLGILLVEARLADGTSRMGRVVVQPNR